jgi:predicted O-methyltransferase YrrM
MKALTHCLKVLLGIEQPQTQVTPAEAAILERYAGTSTIIVELGCYEGRTAVTLAQATTGRVYSIDTFPKGRLKISYTKLIASLSKWRACVQNAIIIHAHSHHASIEFNDPIDLIFIDADHSFEGVEQDWRDWFPKVKAGGFIALHDAQRAECSAEDLGSQRFYSEIVSRLPDIEVVDAVDSLVVLRKLDTASAIERVA